MCIWLLPWKGRSGTEGDSCCLVPVIMIVMVGCEYQYSRALRIECCCFKLLLRTYASVTVTLDLRRARGYYEPEPEASIMSEAVGICMFITVGPMKKL